MSKTGALLGVCIALWLVLPHSPPLWLEVLLCIGCAYLLLTIVAEWFQWFLKNDALYLEAISGLEPELWPSTHTERLSYMRGLLWITILYQVLRLAAVGILAHIVFR